MRQFVKRANPDLWDKPWQDDSVADCQYALAMNQLHKWKNGSDHKPFDVFCNTLKAIGFFRSVLEVGCGCGYYSEVAKTVWDKIAFCGCDISLPMLRHARQSYPYDMWISGDSSRLPLENDAFEVVVLAGLLGHVADWERTIDEAVRVSQRWVVLHRVGCLDEESVSVKEAYGVRMAERYFQEREVLSRIPGQVVHVERWESEMGYQMTCAIDTEAM